MSKYIYVPLGDSYTIGEGASPEESWPAIMCNNLHKEGIDIALAANPSVTGWTTKQLIDFELEVFDEHKANFTTVLIGVNDWVQQVSIEDFTKNLKYILDYVQERLPNKEHCVLVTIPDFGITPEGPKYSKGRDISAGLSEFNAIIKTEAEERNLHCVDIWDISKRMAREQDLLAEDNLHPSAKMYKDWEELIRPVVYKLLK